MYEKKLELRKDLVTFAILERLSAQFQTITAFVDVFAMQKINVLKTLLLRDHLKGASTNRCIKPPKTDELIEQK